ncbi:MAG: hypothetical protein R2867_15220 [Caldilineaceae bacterium]
MGLPTLSWLRDPKTSMLSIAILDLEECRLQHDYLPWPVYRVYRIIFTKPPRSMGLGRCNASAHHPADAQPTTFFLSLWSTLSVRCKCSRSHGF